MKTKPGVYEHFKGGIYIVFGTGKNTETGEEQVLYKDVIDLGSPHIYDNFHIRPSAMFEESVDVNGTLVPRFKELTEEEALEAMKKLYMDNPECETCGCGAEKCSETCSCSE